MSAKMEDPYIGMIFTHLASHCSFLQNSVQDQESLMQRTKDATRRITAHYADLSTFEICGHFDEALTFYRSLKDVYDPKAKMHEVSTPVRKMIFKVQQMASDAVDILGGSLPQVDVDMGATDMKAFAVPSRKAGGIELDIDRIFSEKVDILSDIDLETDSVISSTLKRTFKTICEKTRVETLSCKAYQQLHLDSAYIRSRLLHFVKDAHPLELLLDELMNSAADRCGNPVGLDPAFVHKCLLTGGGDDE